MSLLQSAQTQAPHFWLEVLAYFVAARVYWTQSRRLPRPAEWVDRLVLVSSAVFFAFLGSKLLHILQHLPYLLEQNRAELWLGGKSILGGFLGGFLGTEIAKRWIDWKQSTGDAWVPALFVGIVIGRLGCQVSGLWDQTYGVPTTLPWAWDYGDGIPRHPTALYEILLITLVYLIVRQRWRAFPGARFAAFMGAYCLVRFGLEFLKPPFGGPQAMAAEPDALPAAFYAGLTAIQWAALLGMVWCAFVFRYRLSASPEARQLQLSSVPSASAIPPTRSPKT